MWMYIAQFAAVLECDLVVLRSLKKSSPQFLETTQPLSTAIHAEIGRANFAA
jgi:hypothetical protein